MSEQLNRDELEVLAFNGETHTERALARMLLAGMCSEPLAYFYPGDETEWQGVALAEELDDEQKARCIPLYAAPPAPVAVPDELTREEYKRRFMEEDDFDDTYLGGWNACRAAMLKAVPVTAATVSLDYVQGEYDGREWAAQLAEANHPQTGDWLYDDPFELAKAIRKGPDVPHMAATVPAATVPDGWIKCSERMPDADGNYWGWWSQSKRQGPVWFIKSDL